MLEVLPRIPLFQMYRQFGWPRLLPLNITITPSPRCNSTCLTCNIWKKRESELDTEEWLKVFKSLGKAPFWFTISGGEPFMNKNIVELAQGVYEYCRPGIINIPTNSLMAKFIPPKVEAIAKSCPKTQIIINLSLDGVGEKHDKIRGVPGNFKKFEQNLAALSALSRQYPNLAIGIHTVISKFNVNDALEIFDYALPKTPGAFITEIAEERVELDTIGLDITPEPEDYTRVINELMRRIKAEKYVGIARITQAFRLQYYNLVKRILTEKTQVIGCYAGWASAQIYANGDVWPCCVRADTMLNLREVGYDFKRVWFSPEADRIRRSIYNKECHCPLANASYTNMLHNYAIVGRVAWQVVLATLLQGNIERASQPAA
jgi:MoaA/NifB/PqqE/SkfB family radical SAM enzyme